MGLNWNEIKSRELLFSKNACDSERMAFVFELCQRITGLLPRKHEKPKLQKVDMYK